MIRKATSVDKEALIALEEKVCNEKGIPPETLGGITEFIRVGGQITISESEHRITSAFWTISIGKILSINGEKLPEHSPLRRLVLSETLNDLDDDDLLVFSWLTNDSRGIWLFRHLWRFYLAKLQEKTLIGFVATQDEVAIYNYKKMGCHIVRFLPSLYYESDAHFMLKWIPERKYNQIYQNKHNGSNTSSKSISL